MKKQLLLIGTVAVFGFTACDDSSSSSTTGTDSTTNTNSTTTTNNPGGAETKSVTDLRSGQTITIRRDTSTWRYVDVASGSVVGIYFDPVSHDTFDSRGYILNNALMSDNGNWTIVEERLWENPENVKIKDNDMKLKIEDDKMKMKTDDGKIKQEDGKYKEKTDSTKLKVTDDKIKSKDKR